MLSVTNKCSMLNVIILNVLVPTHKGIQHYNKINCDTQHNNIQQNVIMLSVIDLSVIMLSVIMLGVIRLSVIMLSVIMLSVIDLSVIKLSVTYKPFMSSIVMLIVEAPN